MKERITIQVEYVGKDGLEKIAKRTAENFEIAEQNLESLKRMTTN